MGVVASISFLKNLSVRYNQVKAYNDPFEMSPVFITDQMNKTGQGLEVKYSGYTRNLDSLSFDNIPNGYDRIRPPFIDNINKKMGICCFTYSNEVFPSNLLMWAHYADSHKGIVIQLKDKFLSSPMLNKVRYVDQRPIFDVVDFTKNNEIFISDLFFKSTDWKYENEYRHIQSIEGYCSALKDDNNKLRKINGYNVYLSTFPPEAIDRIILGTDVSNEIVDLAKQFNITHGIPIILLRTSRHDFTLLPKELISSDKLEMQRFANECSPIDWNKH